MDWEAHKEQKFIPHSSGGWKSQVKVPAQLGSAETLLPCLQAVVLSMYSPIRGEGGCEEADSPVFFYKGTNTIMRPLPL